MISIRGLDRLKLFEDQRGMCTYIERIIRKLVNIAERFYCKRLDGEDFAKNKKFCDDSVIVSLTTFPARINYVHLAIKSLLNQTIKPGKIILWLSREQFQGIDIPYTLLELCKYGLEIRYCEDNILAHKKYYYSMKEYPSKTIITYDDDIIYPEDSLEKLLKMHQRYPQAIICNRGREIKVEEGEVAAYRKWKVSGRIHEGVPTYHVMASTGAGTLYPPHCMPEETFDIEKIKELALTADDLWMKVMSIKGEIHVVKSQNRNKGLCISVSNQNVTLAQKNVGLNLNDQVLNKLMRQYPEVRKTLTEQT